MGEPSQIHADPVSGPYASRNSVSSWSRKKARPKSSSSITWRRRPPPTSPAVRAAKAATPARSARTAQRLRPRRAVRIQRNSVGRLRPAIRAENRTQRDRCIHKRQHAQQPHRRRMPPVPVVHHLRKNPLPPTVPPRSPLDNVPPPRKVPSNRPRRAGPARPNLIG